MNELYTNVSKNFWDVLGKGIEIVLATADGEDVTARMVSAAPYEGKIYFSTFENSTKYQQMLKNAQVALCMGPTQVKGEARILGSPNIQENQAVSDVMLAAFPKVYAGFLHAPDMVLVEITPERATFAGAEEGEFFILNFKEQTAQQMKLEM